MPDPPKKPRCVTEENERLAVIASRIREIEKDSRKPYEPTKAG